MAQPIDPKHLLTDARAFLADLAQNNHRDWFKAQKSRYDSEVKRPSERLLADIGRWLEARHNMPVRTKLFRPQRDVRFSPDKTPYHTHLHMMWSLQDGRGWFLGISTDYASAGAGVMGFDAAGLERWRNALDSPRGADLAPLLAGWRLSAPDLAKVPPAYPTDHPQAEFLRREGLVAWQDGLDTALRDDPQTALQAAFDRFTPLMQWLGTTVSPNDP